MKAEGSRATTASPQQRPALMANPFGNGLCLLQFLCRGYDEIAQP